MERVSKFNGVQVKVQEGRDVRGESFRTVIFH